jgi:hypothetical protein
LSEYISNLLPPGSVKPEQAKQEDAKNPKDENKEEVKKVPE